MGGMEEVIKNLAYIVYCAQTEELRMDEESKLIEAICSAMFPCIISMTVKTRDGATITITRNNNEQ